MAVVNNRQADSKLSTADAVNDIFNEGLETDDENDNTPEVEETEAPVEELAKADKPSKELVEKTKKSAKTHEEGSIGWHQARADRAEQALRDMEVDVKNPESVKELKRMAELGKLIKENPEQALKALGVQVPEKKQEVQELKMPVKPVKPQGYNRSDAVLDPESESYRYQLAQDEYLEQVAEYQLAVSSKSIEKQRQEQDLVERERAKNEGRVQVVSDLINKKGFSKTEAESFYTYFNTLLTSTDTDKMMDEFTEFYKFKNQPKAQEKTKPQNKTMPLPAVTGASEDEEDTNDDDNFWNGIVASKEQFHPSRSSYQNRRN